MVEVLVSRYMSKPVFTISADASLDEARDRLTRHGVSSLAVSDGGNPIAAVISRTDLLAAGTVDIAEVGLQLKLPPKKVRDIANKDVITVNPETETVQAAAAQMVDRRMHRVFAAKGEYLYGVLSTRDIMSWVTDARLEYNISALMSTPVQAVKATDPIEQAVDRLKTVGTTALVVVNDRIWPVGLFTQVQALEANAFFSSDKVDRVMSRRFIVVHANSVVHHVAAQAVATKAHHAVVVDEDEVVGVVSGLDFARVASEHTADGHQ